MNEHLRAAALELRADPLTAFWLAGNAVGFLTLLRLLVQA